MLRALSHLLTVSNPKTLKGQTYGYLTAILHLAPADLSGYQTCASSTAACRAACLNTAGRGGMGLDANGLNVIQRARIAKTQWYFEDRPAFMTRLVREIDTFARYARRSGFQPAIRLNGTSDLRWETVPAAGLTNVFERFPDVQFYDYTKHANRRGIPANYHLTFSLAETARSWRAHEIAIEHCNVAVVLRGAGDSRYPRPMPETWNGRPLIDGDTSDLRFRDNPSSGAYVGLRAKGRAIRDTSGFVYDIEHAPVAIARPLALIA